MARRASAPRRAYVRSEDALLAREAAQLRLFAEHGQLRVCSVAGYARGALFTDAVIGGVALDELLLAEPDDTGELLREQAAAFAADVQDMAVAASTP